MSRSIKFKNNDYLDSSGIIHKNTANNKDNLKNILNHLSAITDLANTIKSSPGYTTLPNGIIIQWGIFTGTGTTNFPIAFPNACLIVLCDGMWAQDSNPAYKTLSGISYWNNTGFTRASFGYMNVGTYGEAIATQSYRALAGIGNFGGQSRWIAIGY